MKFLLSFIFLLSIICNVSFAYDLRIIDGDTIELNGERIRFGGIDTPERGEIGHKFSKQKLKSYDQTTRRYTLYR